MIWKFRPLSKRRIWGGGTLHAMYPALSSSVAVGDEGLFGDLVGEVWLLSGISGSESIVSQGADAGKSLNDLVREYGRQIMGDNNLERYGETFPLLIKLIDAAQDLSIQVHPGDEMARESGMMWGKSEMWYVIGTEPNARLAVGFNAPQEPKRFREMTLNGDVCQTLRYTSVRTGDLFYIPSGRIHVLGAGCKVLEIQQTSDVTYRLYDYHRKDVDGKERELHTELGYRALNFNDTSGHSIDYDRESRDAVLMETPHFTAKRRLLGAGEKINFQPVDSFRILVCLSGAAAAIEPDGEEMMIRPGECMLISADSEAVINTQIGFEAVETYIEK
ncbi:MAG: class I mannose-6-phosphate isomerase [Muribaculaceae bacterium]|nr:class I mannose-6-phosphate isomerase [Muribaculaceae bacterium]